MQDDTLILSGLTYACIDSQACYQGFYLVKMDTFGEILQEKVIYEEGDDIVAENFPMLCQTEDGGYFLTAEYFQKGNGLVAKVDADLNLEFIREYTEDPQEILSVRNRGILRLHHDYYISSRKQHKNYHGYAHLMKIDSVGNLIWDKSYNTGDDAQVKCKVAIDGNIIMFGQRSKETDTGTIAMKQWYLKIDTAGIVIDEYESGWMVNQIAGYFDLLELEDGFMIATANFYYDSKQTPYPYYQTVLQKLDPEFAPLWTTTYGSLTPLNSIYQLSMSPEGNFVGTGVYLAENLQQSAMTVLTLKFDEYGSILWERQDSILYESNYGCRNTAGEMVILESGSMMTVGSGETFLPNHENFGFVEKLDKNGCIIPGCVLSDVDEPAQRQEELFIYPNPATNLLHIDSKLTDIVISLKIYDPLGRVIHPEIHQDEINVSNWTDGVYLFVLNERYYQKVIIVH